MSIVRPQFVAYRLLEDGKLISLRSDEIHNNLVPVNILSFYFIKQKRLYIWIGDYASKKLRAQIPLIDGFMIKNHPLFSILRHFTIEGFKSETEELLDLLRISISEYQKKFEEFEVLRAKIQQEMQESIKKAYDAFDDFRFEEAISQANKIIDYADKIFDTESRKKWEQFINQVLSTQNNTLEIEISKRIQPLIKEYDKLVSKQNFEAARQKVSEIQAIVVKSRDRGLQRHWEFEIPDELRIQEQAWLGSQQKKMSQDEALIAQKFTDIKTEIDNVIEREDVAVAKMQLNQLENVISQTKIPETKTSYQEIYNSLKERVSKLEMAMKAKEEIQKKMTSIQELITARKFNEARQSLERLAIDAEAHSLIETVKKINTMEIQLENAERELNDLKQKASYLVETIAKEEKMELYDMVIEDCQNLITILITLNDEAQVQLYTQKLEEFRKKDQAKRSALKQTGKNNQSTLDDMKIIPGLNSSLHIVEDALNKNQLELARKTYDEIPLLLATLNLDSNRTLYHEKADRVYEILKRQEIAFRHQIEDDMNKTKLDHLVDETRKSLDAQNIADGLHKNDQIAAIIPLLHSSELKQKYGSLCTEFINRIHHTQKISKSEATLLEEDKHTIEIIEKMFSDLDLAIQQENLTDARTKYENIAPMLVKIHNEYQRGVFEGKSRALGARLDQIELDAKIKAEDAELIAKLVELVPYIEEAIKSNNLEHAKLQLLNAQETIGLVKQAELKAKYKPQCDELAERLKQKAKEETSRFEGEKQKAIKAEQSAKRQKALYLKEMVQEAINKEDWGTARQLNGELEKLVSELATKTEQDNLSIVVKDNFQLIIDGEQRTDAVNKATTLLDAVRNSIATHSFEAAEKDLTVGAAIVEKHHIQSLMATLHETQNLLKQEKLYAQLCQIVAQNEQANQWKSGIGNCKKILELIPILHKDSDLQIYEALLTKFELLAGQDREQTTLQQAEIQKNIAIIQQILTVDEDVLPQMEEIPLDNLLKEIQANIPQLLDHLNTILEKHRIEVKSDVDSTAVLRSKTGETLEFSKQQHITVPSSSTTPVAQADGIIPPIIVPFTSQFDNPFDDAIEEAILEDSIPYNFEITETKVEGPGSYDPPTKSMGMKGLNMKWTLREIPPKKQVQITYDLRPRVSRTVIVPLEAQLKIVKTHSTLNPLKYLGLFDVKLNFINDFKQVLKGVVFEDIIPPLYIYDVKRPEDEKPSTSEITSGIAVKWNMKQFAEAQKMLHEYQLLELFRFEELKMVIRKLDKEGFGYVEAGDAEHSWNKYTEIVDTLKKYTR